MNVILERTNQVPYFTNMRQVFDGLGLSAADFDWYISDIETNYYGHDFVSDDKWITGKDLQHFLEENEVQFIWAVFSAVPKGFRTDVEQPPYVDGNSDYWDGTEVTPQLPGALFEIACWDSSATILVGLPDNAVEKFCLHYPDIRALAHCRT